MKAASSRVMLRFGENAVGEVPCNISLRIADVYIFRIPCGARNILEGMSPPQIDSQMPG